jgi:hypothetical protein
MTFFTYEPEDDDGFTWVKKGDEKRFKVARNGDNLLTLFQCELCVFRNTHLREPGRTQTDTLALCVYRRANLDAFWSRERTTVSSNRLWLRRGVELNEAVDQQFTFQELGPMPLADLTGHGVACQELLASTRPGTYHDDHCQYDTVRKLRSAYSSLRLASAQGAVFNLSGGRDQNGRSITFTDCATESEWFKRFSQGMKKRMGQDVRPQLGFSVEVMLVLLERLEVSWRKLPNGNLKDNTLGALAYSAVSFTNALRGNEGFKMDLFGLQEHISRGLGHAKFPHVVAPLLGRFKGQDGERLHFLFMVPITSSGIKTRCYLEWLVRRREEQGLFHGPAFCDHKGREIESGVYEDLILGVLHEHQVWEKKTQSWNDHRLLDGVDIDERYGIFRSFKRGAITRAQEAGVSEADVNRAGQWRKVEAAKGRHAGGSMREHYTELVQLLDARLRFSRAL